MKNPILMIGSISLALVANMAWATDDENLMGIQIESISTSDNFERNAAEAKYGGVMPGGIHYGLEAGHHQMDKNGQRYQATEAKIRGGVEINDMLFFEGSVGSGKVAEKNGNKAKQLTSYRVRGEAKLTEQVTVGVEHSKDFVFKDQLLTDANGDIMTAESTRADVKFRAAERVRLEADTTKRELSDGNASQKSKVGAFYGISPSWPWVWAGVEAEHLDFDQQKPGYWTPKNHKSVAASFASSFPVNDTLDLSSSISVGRGKDDDSVKAGTTYYASVGANAKVSENGKLSAEAHYIKAQQSNSAWDETGGSVGLTFKHY